MKVCPKCEADEALARWRELCARPAGNPVPEAVGWLEQALRAIRDGEISLCSKHRDRRRRACAHDCSEPAPKMPPGTYVCSDCGAVWQKRQHDRDRP